MRIHLTGAFEYRDVRVGFGNAAEHIYQELRSAGIHAVCKKVDDERIKRYPVEMCFDQPHRFKFSCPDAYRIGYVPWESTGIPREWYAPLQSCDEIWTPNEFGRGVFSHHFPDKPVFVYQHGVSSHYKPRKRKLSNDKPFTFLFIGEPQSRKDGQSVADTFIKLFGNNADYRLIIKATHTSKITVVDPRASNPRNAATGTPDFFYDNIITYTKMLNPEQMLQLYDEADMFVYPSWGEGWGFNPLQAMAMGLPTISTSVWADYAKYITIPIDSYLHQSPWQDLHPGEMFKPDRDQLIKAMSISKENYEQFASIAFKNSFKIHEEYNWHQVSLPAIERLEKIFFNLQT